MLQITYYIYRVIYIESTHKHVGHLCTQNVNSRNMMVMRTWWFNIECSTSRKQLENSCGIIYLKSVICSKNSTKKYSQFGVKGPAQPQELNVGLVHFCKPWICSFCTIKYVFMSGGVTASVTKQETAVQDGVQHY